MKIPENEFNLSQLTNFLYIHNFTQKCLTILHLFLYIELITGKDKLCVWVCKQVSNLHFYGHIKKYHKIVKFMALIGFVNIYTSFVN